MSKERGCDIQWNDVHNQNDLVAEINSELKFVRERLHVLDEKGELHVRCEAGSRVVPRSDRAGRFHGAFFAA